MRPGAPPFLPANSLLGRTNSLFWQKISLFSEEQGIGRKLLNSLGDRLQKPRQVGGIEVKFPKIPC
jgi:hypothetical protein